MKHIYARVSKPLIPRMSRKRAMSLKFLWMLLLFVPIEILIGSTGRAETVSILDREKIILEYVRSFNQKDAEQMLLHTSPQVLWMSVNGDKISVETKGQQSLKEALQSYFKHTPSIQSELLTVHATGQVVYTVEKAYWEKNGKTKSQCSPAMYQFENKKIIYVWYFPSFPC